MKRKYIQDPVTLQLVPAEEYYKAPENVSAYIIPDIEPFQSIATADKPVISSRSKMRQYCKDRGLVPAEECKGLPMRPAYQPAKRDRDGVIKALVQAFDQHR